LNQNRDNTFFSRQDAATTATPALVSHPHGAAPALPIRQDGAAFTLPPELLALKGKPPTKQNWKGPFFANTDPQEFLRPRETNPLGAVGEERERARQEQKKKVCDVLYKEIRQYDNRDQATQDKIISVWNSSATRAAFGSTGRDLEGSEDGTSQYMPYALEISRARELWGGFGFNSGPRPRGSTGGRGLGALWR
jgi:hypothetical protein